ncbi:unnamed protein product [Blepharisma stoltei]|uniref:Endonuclease/exonuclease/phosphatase domain-containing protein n=1 Tax=Blepharisma stoltei TaxID=1481888 RepID=A0AAU9IGN0_9CILI|nr:unnamed protein product [Blepharisma stoltei]
MLKVSTFNILNSCLYYEHRSPLITRTINEMDSDIVGLQEIDYNGNANVYNHPGYSFIFSPAPIPLKWTELGSINLKIDGNGILIKNHIKIIAEGYLTYKSNTRVAQRMKIRVDGKEIWIVNTHLDHISDEVRLEQALTLIEWLRPMMDSPIIVMGDLNCFPGSETYEVFIRHFKSSMKEIYGKEPDVTWPTEMLGSRENWERFGEVGCIDYIWFKNLNVVNGRVITDIKDGQFYPSDHYPVQAVFDLGIPN